MLDEICAICRNYFVREVFTSSSFTIKNGSIAQGGIADGQYFRICGSVFNDGVYKYPAKDLTDEVFGGEIWAMAPPPAFIALAEEIAAWEASDAAKPLPYASESFGGYSYTRATDGSGAPLSWQSVFAKKLNRWRKI